MEATSGSGAHATSLEVIKRRDEFLTGIHHERTLRGHWLANWLATELVRAFEAFGQCLNLRSLRWARVAYGRGTEDCQSPLWHSGQ